jgi:hypothetical protein
MDITKLSREELETLQQLINKALETPQSSDFDFMLQDIIDNFDFDRVHNVMDYLNWQWATCSGVPTIEELKEKAISLLRDASELRLGGYKDTHHELPIMCSTGGLEAKAWCDEDKTQIVGLELKFVLTSWDSDICEDEED